MSSKHSFVYDLREVSQNKVMDKFDQPIIQLIMYIKICIITV